MANIVNFRIKDPTRLYYFLADKRLNKDEWLPVDISELSEGDFQSIIMSLDIEEIEADKSVEHIKQYGSGSSSGLDEIIVSNIAERDAIPHATGQEVIVLDNGSGKREKFESYNSTWVSLGVDGQSSIPNLSELSDVDMAPGAINDDFIVSYSHGLQKFVLRAEQEVHSQLSGTEIESLYEGLGNTNKYTDGEKLKLSGIQPGATVDQSAEQVPVSLTGYSATNVRDLFSELNTKKSDINHTHAEYALVGHDHDDRYSLLVHNHDEDYAAKIHDHDDRYSLLGHSHSEYSLKTHSHDSDYAKIAHDHDERYSLLSHNHDLEYSSIGHNHDGRYELKLPNPITNGEVMLKDVDGTVKFITQEELCKSEINDGSLSLTKAWSSSKINDELNSKSDTGHNHDSQYSVIGHSHSEFYLKTESDSMFSLSTHNHDSQYASISHNHSSVYAGIGHNHDTVYSKLNHTHDGLAPAGGATGFSLKKRSDADFDYHWVEDIVSGGNEEVFKFILGPGNSINDRMVGAQDIPQGWTISDAATAGVGNFGASTDTLVMVHNNGKLVTEICIFELTNSGPATVQGLTKVNLNSQGVQKNSTDFNSAAVIGAQSLTSSDRTLYICVKMV